MTQQDREHLARIAATGIDLAVQELGGDQQPHVQDALRILTKVREQVISLGGAA